jgi:hypothetical protein
VERSSAASDVMHPFGGTAASSNRASGSGVPLSSTQPEPVEEPRVAQPRSHNYFPGMRPARAMQQPVRLTAQGPGMLPHVCTPSRSAMIGAHGGHR